MIFRNHFEPSNKLIYVNRLNDIYFLTSLFSTLYTLHKLFSPTVTILPKIDIHRFCNSFFSYPTDFHRQYGTYLLTKRNLTLKQNRILFKQQSSRKNNLFHLQLVRKSFELSLVF